MKQTATIRRRRGGIEREWKREILCLVRQLVITAHLRNISIESLALLYRVIWIGADWLNFAPNRVQAATEQKGTKIRARGGFIKIEPSYSDAGKELRLTPLNMLIGR